MHKWFEQLLYPPVFGGPGNSQSVKLLRFVFQFTFIIVVISLITNLIIQVELERFLPMTITLVALVFLNSLLKQETLELTGFVYLMLVTLVVFAFAYLSGGLNSPVLLILVVISFFAGVLLGGRGGLFFSAFSLIIVIYFVVIEYYRPIEPKITYLPIDYVIVYTTVFVSIMGLLVALMVNLREVLDQAEKEIAERRQAENSFRKLEQRYKAVFDRTNDAIVLMNLDSTVMDINQRGEEMFGVTHAEIIGKSGLDYIAPDERNLGLHQLHTILSGQIIPLYERKMLRHNGEEFPVEINLSLVWDETGEPVQTQSVLREITERKKTEEKLQHIQNRYSALFEAQTDGIFFIGLDGTILEANRQASRLLGYSREEIIGQSVYTFVIPEERDNLTMRLESLKKGQQPPLYERNFLSRTRGILSMEVNSMMVYDKDGVPQGIQSIVRDISERKQKEEELHTLIHQLENQRARIKTAVDVSKAAISILEPDILSQKIVDLVKERFEYYYVGLFLLSEDETHAVLRAGTGEAGQKMLKAGHALPIGSSSMIGWSIAHKTPRIALDVGLDAVHFDNPHLPDTRSELALPLLVRGEAIGALTVQSQVEAAFSGEDIAVLQVMIDLLAVAIQNARYHTRVSGYAEELEQRVRERTAELEATNRELESFSYSVSHDLRTPLRAINGYSSILLEEFLDELSPLARSYQEKIRKNASRMGELVDGLLAFSRLGRKLIQKTRVYPQNILHELLLEQEGEIAQRQITVVLGNLPPCEADPLLIQQVFTNLLNNAIKFTRNTPHPQIEIGSEPTPRGLSYFVRDNGAGFDMQYADRLFGVFQRLHRDDEFEGNGVGLAIIQRIIHRHGGDVWAEGAVGRGATFYFTLEGGYTREVPPSLE
ncbi:MAG: PAS domain S-box protein [Anaerolineales bacterium]|nr:PAS domain S-box protein [Anaerolineales bacterium]